MLLKLSIVNNHESFELILQKSNVVVVTLFVKMPSAFIAFVCILNIYMFTLNMTRLTCTVDIIVF